MTNLLRYGYLTGLVVGAALYLFWVIPTHWHWDAYGGRDFSTPERLLTQARVLCLYLWQILVPLPQHMPFYYDWIQPSRGLLQPWTTLPAILILLGLLTAGWQLRTRSPLFSLGILLFFAAHFITSNVIGLELAFEHRNHFALIGAVLAVGSLLTHLGRRLHLPPLARGTGIAMLLVALGTATMLRAHDWRSNLDLHRASAASAPGSARAWVALCADLFRAGGGAVAENPLLDDAIAACEAGTVSAPYALNNFALLIALKSLRGDVTPQDWEKYRQQIEAVRMSWDNRRSIQILIYRSRNGISLDKAQMLKTLASVTQRASFEPYQLAAFGYYAMIDLDVPDQAMPFFEKAIKPLRPDDPFPGHLAVELREINRPDLAAQVEHWRPTAPAEVESPGVPQQ